MGCRASSKVPERATAEHQAGHDRVAQLPARIVHIVTHRAIAQTLSRSPRHSCRASLTASTHELRESRISQQGERAPSRSDETGSIS